MRQRLGVILAAVSAMSIATLTLRSNPALREFVASTPLTCVICGEEGALDFLLNIVFFAPLGAGLYLAGVRPVRIVAAGAAMSLTVETIQYFLLVGRDASLGDLLSNTLGAAAGAGVAHLAWLRTAVDRSTARRRLLAAVALGYAGLVLGGWALQPSTSTSGTWHARTAFEAPDAVPFRGTIERFQVGQVPVAAGTVADPTALRAALDLPLREVMVQGRGALVADPEAWLAELDADGHVEVSIGQEWCAFTYIGRRHAFDLRLHEAGIYVDAPCRESLHDAFEVRATQSSSRMSLSLRDAHGERVSSAALYLATGWVNFWPYVDYIVPRRPVAEVLWLALLFAPSGIWLAPAAIGAGGVGILLAVSSGLLYALTAAFRLSAVEPVHLLALPLGILTGMVARLGWQHVMSRS